MLTSKLPMEVFRLTALERKKSIGNFNWKKGRAACGLPYALTSLHDGGVSGYKTPQM